MRSQDVARPTRTRKPLSQKSTAAQFRTGPLSQKSACPGLVRIWPADASQSAAVALPQKSSALKKSGAAQSNAAVALLQKSIRPAREVHGFPADAGFGATPVMAMKSLSGLPAPSSPVPAVPRSAAFSCCVH